MNLTQISLVRITGDSRAMLYQSASMGVAFDAVPGNEADTSLVELAEGMPRAGADSDNPAGHTSSVASGYLDRRRDSIEAAASRLRR
jgi:hypothetical protein